ncbi:hypothetical protein PGB28_06290 [Primorskyibacter aestuariivivens]|uniref:hypothetical protein n=1 Tax=Primorskyibacter aestuariivivens TaxID=1888912 RepID=UPI002300F391|nr:hypothetical protein [Primorskyibacter aestuariivivens]MDA7428059.1 hypothetical protein [Primorskyibacter aestuariivivens]
MTRRHLSYFASLALALCLTLLPFSAQAETPMGSVIESRLLVGIKTDADAVTDMMPAGWVAIPYPKGPMTGSNAILALLDAHLVLDTEGKPADPATRTTAAILGLGKETGGKGIRQFVLVVYTDDPDANPYGNTITAQVQRERGLSGTSGTARSASESWTVSEGDTALTLSLSYEMGTPGWSLGKSAAFSAADPDFAVSQTYQQLAELVSSEALGKPLNGELSYSSNLKGLSPLLNGSEEVQAIVSIPMYIRDVFHP